jgi:hypothetical protein
MRLRSQRQKSPARAGRAGPADSLGEGAGGRGGEGGTVLKTSLDHTKEAALQAALAGVQAALPASPLSSAR